MSFNLETFYNKIDQIKNNPEIQILPIENIFEEYINYFLNNDKSNIKRTLILKNPSLLKSLEYYFPNLTPSEIYYLCLLKTSKIPKCQCGREVSLTKKGYNLTCRICARKKTNKLKKEDILAYNSTLPIPNLKEKIIEYIKNINPRSFYQSLRKIDLELIKQIYKRTEYLDLDVSFNERIYHIINDLNQKPFCSNCLTKHPKFLDFNRGYSKFCSNKCSQQFIKKLKGEIIGKNKRKTFFDFHLNLFKKIEIDVLSSKEEFISKNILKLKCRKCKNEFELKNEKQIIHRCKFCSPRSKAQIEIFNFISSLGFECKNNEKKELFPNYEIDIFIPKVRLGIEYNGLFWHSELQLQNKNYHLEKTNFCKQKNITLLHIFENEWINPNKQEIWKSIIKSKLGLNRKIGARKCQIREVSYNESRLFLEENHLQGNCKDKIRLGLYFNNELVSLLNLGKSRFNKKYEWEILRFANKKGINVIGGFSKLFKEFRKKYSGSVITYADKRYSEGNLYRKNGFKELKDSAPNYFYFKDRYVLFNRIYFQKHKLSKILENYNPKLSEWENMKNHNWNRIWDCGNKIFVLEN